MKTIIRVLSLLLLLNTSNIIQPEKASAQVSVGFQFFYDQMSPYGSWVSYPQYGYVWIPNVAPGFSPYCTGGHWVFTQFGWMWVSDYQWGWAAFHYGSWNYDPYYGWMWIPGNEWAPAWVVWSSAPGYYGWAPLGPGININLVINGGYRIPADRWVFVQSQYIDRPDIDHYYGPRSNNTVIINKTTIINNTYVDNSTHVTYVRGPERNEVQKVTGRNVESVDVRSMDAPGQKVSKSDVSLYRPRIEKTITGAQQPAPKKVVRIEDVKQEQQKNAPAQQRETTPKHATPEKNQVQPKQVPQHQDVTPKKEPVEKQNDPNPKMIRQTAQGKYDYPMNQKSSVSQNQNRMATVPKAQQSKTVETNRSEVTAVAPKISKGNQYAVKQAPTVDRKSAGTKPVEVNKYEMKKVAPANSTSEHQPMKQASVADQKATNQNKNKK